MRDVPSGNDLLQLAREILIGALLPSLPAEKRLDARIVAAAMAIAEREGRAGERPLAVFAGQLASFYGLSAEAAGAESEAALWRRFAGDLREGAFRGAPSRERAARSLLWRLTLWKLSEGNPKFLADNGFKA